MTAVGTNIRPCFNAKKSDTHAGVPLVRARLGNVFTVDAVSTSPAPNGAVRINGVVWIKSWLKVP